MGDEYSKPASTSIDDDSVETLTDFIDRLEQKSFMRSLDERHPVDAVKDSMADADNS